MIKRGTGIVDKICQRCSKNFKARHDKLGLFCSRSCASKRPHKNYKVEKVCEVCKIKYFVRKYRENISLYCSKECRRKRMPSKEMHPRWKGGLSRTWESKVLIKKLILLRKECENCRSKENLQGHHIIPYSENKDLQSCENNIQILCRLCHSKQHPEIAKFILKGLMHE